MFRTLPVFAAICHYLCIIILLFSPALLFAQGWKELNPPPGIFNKPIHSTIIGPGDKIYASGEFRNSNDEYIVGVLNNNLWSELGAGNSSLKANNAIYTLAKSPGKLYAAGVFANATGWPYVAQWDGTSWSELRSSSSAFEFNNTIFSLTTDKAGNIYAAGFFTNANGFHFVAKWNGSSWQELGTGTSALRANAIIYALATDSLGNVYAAGQFTNASGKRYVAKWNSTTWSELGTGPNTLAANDYIQSLLINASGHVYAAGSFTNNSGEPYVARWKGTAWAETGNGAAGLHANAPINALSLNANGDVYACGYFTDAMGVNIVSRWSGTSWQTEFGVPTNLSVCVVNSLTIDNAGNLFAGGSFTNSIHRYYVAKWDGARVTEPGRNNKNLEATNGIEHIAADANGHVYAIGNFVNKNGYNYIAHWDGITWSELGGDTASLRVDYMNSSMATDNNGNLYVGSSFKNASNHYYIAKWDGSAWSQLGGPADPIKVFEPIRILATDKYGNVYAGGAFGDSSGFSYGVTKWDGVNATFYPFPPGYPVSLCVDSIGNIYAGNSQYDDNYGVYYVVKMNNQGWSVLGSGATALNSRTPITALAIDGKGNLLAGSLNNQGLSTYGKFVAKWDGTAWSEAGNDPTGKYAEGRVYSMASDKYGNVYAATHSGATLTYNTVAKWDGQQWTELGTGDSALNAQNNIYTVATDTNGNVYAAGIFDNGAGHHYVAMYGAGGIGGEEFAAPEINGLSATYCANQGDQLIVITNAPPAAEVTVELDGTQLTLTGNNSFSFNTQDLQPGEHNLTVIYSKADVSKSTANTFAIMPVATPDVALSASATHVNSEAGTITITASNVAGGGSSPLYTFAAGASMENPLQPESGDNTLHIEPSALIPGANWIYVRLRTSETCTTAATEIDSIRITREASASGLVDSDYPDAVIAGYPNPIIGNNITISGLNETKSYTVRLVNANGGNVYEKQINNTAKASLRLPALSGNFYWLHIYDNTKNRSIGSIMVMKR